MLSVATGTLETTDPCCVLARIPSDTFCGEGRRFVLATHLRIILFAAHTFTDNGKVLRNCLLK